MCIQEANGFTIVLKEEIEDFLVRKERRNNKFPENKVTIKIKILWRQFVHIFIGFGIKRMFNKTHDS